MKRLTQIFQALLGAGALIITALIAAGRLARRTIRNWWSKRSKWLRRSIATTLILIPVGFVALVAYAFYEHKHGRNYWDRRVSDNITMHSFNNEKWRIYNEIESAYTTGEINWLSEAHGNDSLAVYAIPDKRGYINVNTGRVIIDAEANNYSKAWVFSEGLAAVVKDGRIGFINPHNEVVIPFHFYDTDKCRMWDYGYLFHNGLCIMTDKDGNIGLIDRSGNWVVEAAYDEIWTPDDNGCRIIIKDGKYGVLDPAGKILYPTEYLHICIVPNGFVLTKCGKQWRVDLEGNTVRPFIFDRTYYLKYPDGYNESGELVFVFSEYVKYEIMDCYGIMNRITGEPVTPAIYSDINMLSKDMFEVQEYDSYDWHLIDTKGNAVNK